MSEPKWAGEGKVLGELIDASGYERKEFARLLDVSEDILSNMVRGITRLKGERRRVAANLLTMTDDQLRQKLTDGNLPPPKTPSKELAREDKGPLTTVNIRGKIIVVPKGMTAVPIYGAVPAGNPGRSFSDAISVEYMTDWDPEVRRWGRIVEGNSMLPFFENGDTVIFEERQPEAMQAVYAHKDGDDTFKILRPTGVGKAELWPLNDAYEPFDAAGWTILGVVIRRIRYLDDGTDEVKNYPVTYKFRMPK